MKLKFLCLFAMSILSLTAISQEFYYSLNSIHEFHLMHPNVNYNYMDVNEKQLADNIKKHRVQSILISSLTDKKRKVVSETHFSQNGKVEQIKKFDRKNRISLYHYDYDKGKLVSARLTKQNESIARHERIYNQNNRIVQSSFYGKDDQLMTLVKYNWMDTSVLSSKTRYRKSKLRSKQEYEYYDDQQMKIQRYFKKGKLRKVYKYDCDPKGEIQNKKSIEKQICKITNVDEFGRRQEITKTSDYKGRPKTIINTYDNTDKLVLSETRNSLNQLMWNYIYSDSVDIRNHFRKGKLVSTRKKEKDDRGNIVAQKYFRKGKPKHSSTYVYNDDNFMTSSKYFNVKGELYSELKFEYNYF